jgi:hypothetical protein
MNKVDRFQMAAGATLAGEYGPMAEFEDRLLAEPGRVTIRAIASALGDYAEPYWNGLLSAPVK